MRLYDILGLLKTNEIKLVDKKPEASGSYLFSFEFKPDLEWKAGQHGMFKFKGEKLYGGNFRPFSVASTKDENIIIILTKIGDTPSGFKSKLKSMEVGDTISLRGPFGGFYISDYNRPMVMVAGGVGITPMRALLKDIDGNGILTDASLLYIDSSGEFAFKEELEIIKRDNPNISIHFLNDRKILDEKLSDLTNRHNNNATYFISGSPKMVKDIKNKIEARGIKKRNIINDSFRGY